MILRKLRVRNDAGNLIVDRVIQPGGDLFQLWVPWGEDVDHPILRNTDTEEPGEGVTLIDSNGPVTITIESWDSRG